MEVIHENFKGEIFEIWKKGENPNLLLFSGTHGDEYSTIPLIKDFILKNLDKFPEFIYIPRLSPSAVALRTRTNKDGADVNRTFFKEGLKTVEAQYMERVIGRQTFSLVTTFHEDVGHEHFYLYDYLSEKEQRNIAAFVKDLKEELLKHRVGLLSGVDDPADVELGYEFKDGYRTFAFGQFQEDGQFEHWAIITGKAARILVPEVPTRLPKDIQNKIIEALFSKLILKIKTNPEIKEGAA